MGATDIVRFNELRFDTMRQDLEYLHIYLWRGFFVFQKLTTVFMIESRLNES
jgi:hypothetical protein